MPTQRIRQLQQFYDEDPHDPFNAYALALEYLNHDHVKSRALFELLLNDHKEYLPTYYHAAKFFAESGETTRAVQVYEAGMTLAKMQNDQKALRELRSAYDEMMFE